MVMQSPPSEGSFRGLWGRGGGLEPSAGSAVLLIVQNQSCSHDLAQGAEAFILHILGNDETSALWLFVMSVVSRSWVQWG